MEIATLQCWKAFSDENKKFHERLQEFVENLETASRVFVKRKLQRSSVWKAFSENKKFHECLFDIYMNIQFKC